MINPKNKRTNSSKRRTNRKVIRGKMPTGAVVEAVVVVVAAEAGEETSGVLMNTKDKVKVNLPRKPKNLKNLTIKKTDFAG